MPKRRDRTPPLAFCPSRDCRIKARVVSGFVTSTACVAWERSQSSGRGAWLSLPRVRIANAPRSSTLFFWRAHATHQPHTPHDTYAIHGAWSRLCTDLLADLILALGCCIRIPLQPPGHEGMSSLGNIVVGSRLSLPLPHAWQFLILSHDRRRAEKAATDLCQRSMGKSS